MARDFGEHIGDIADTLKNPRILMEIATCDVESKIQEQDRESFPMIIELE